MEQLSEMDYSLLRMESPRAPQHIAPVMFYDQSGVKGGKVRFKDILRAFENNLHKSAVFRRRLGGSSMGFDTPYWVEDQNFDLEFHVRHIALPKPGDWRQLCILLARLHSRALDLSRPLWEAYVIEGLNKVEGLPRNSFAIMLKMHHAAVDGVSAAEILNAIHSLTPGRMQPRVPDDWQGEPDPAPLQVWRRAAWNNLRRPVQLVRTLREVVPRLVQANREAGGDDEKAPGFRSRFNGPISAHRVVDAFILDLERVKAIRQSVEGVTINDVIVAVVGGGLRKYLMAKNDLPQRSMSTGVPISVRAERSTSSHGNQVSWMGISLATDIEDPLERLKAVHESALKAKDYASAVGVRAVMDISQGLWPTLIGAGVRLAVALPRTSEMGLPLQTVVSNVPGPQVPMYMAGARLHMLLGLGPLTHGLGLFHALISGGGKIPITFVACRDILPDPQFYRECLQEAWEELEAAAGAPGRRARAAKSPAAAAARKKRPRAARARAATPKHRAT